MQATTVPLPTSTGLRLGVRLQLILALGLLVALVGVIAGVALWGLARIYEPTRQATEINGRLSRLTSNVSIQTLLARRYEKDFFLNIADPNARADYLKKWRQATQDLDQAVESFAASATTPDDQRWATEWRSELAGYRRGVDEIVGKVEVGSITTPQAANEEFTPFKNTIRSLTDNSVDVAANKATAATEAEALLQER